MTADPVGAILDAYTPPFADVPRRWDEVVSRAGSRKRRAAALCVSAAGAAAVALAVLLPPTSTPSVLARASFALGDKPVLHVVVADGLASSGVDLRTGERRPASGRVELWSDPKLGLRVVRSFRGRATAPYYFRAPGGLSDFATGYRAKLRRHAFHVIGSGTVGGVSVYWIESKPEWGADLPSPRIHRYVEQVAISKATYKPVLARTLRDGRLEHGSTTRVSTIETTAAEPQLFAHRRNPVDAGWTPTSPPLSPGEAHPPVPSRIAGMPRTWLGEPPFLAGCCTQLAGVSAYFGPVEPRYTGRYVAITEFPHPNAMTRQLGAGYFPPEGEAVLDGPDVGSRSEHTATLRAHGMYVIVEATSDADALAAARTLSR